MLSRHERRRTGRTGTNGKDPKEGNQSGKKDRKDQNDEKNPKESKLRPWSELRSTARRRLFGPFRRSGPSGPFPYFSFTKCGTPSNVQFF
jgi:hypothetical protein